MPARRSRSSISAPISPASRRPICGSRRSCGRPANAAAEDNQFGIAPHADAGFLTMLPQSAVPGLEIRTASGRWLAAPSLPGNYLVNTGDTLNRWTNGRFLSTPHRASNHSGDERYATPFFYDPNTDTMIECLPTCQGPDHPPKHPPQTYGELYAWFTQQNYKHINMSYTYQPNEPLRD